MQTLSHTEATYSMQFYVIKLNEELLNKTC